MLGLSCRDGIRENQRRSADLPSRGVTFRMLPPRLISHSASENRALEADTLK